MTDFFTPQSVAYKLRPGEFDDLSKSTKKKLIKLMARISEKSYRRGFQHGGLEGRTIDPVKFRFDIDLKYSPWTDVVGKRGEWVNSRHSSMERLFAEYRVLNQLGLHG